MLWEYAGCGCVCVRGRGESGDGLCEKSHEEVDHDICVKLVEYWKTHQA